ncbi:site-specific integrase [Virgibacillus sp. LDC1]|nr:site-specific integrase [Virgibacillus sp. LDC1]
MAYFRKRGAFWHYTVEIGIDPKTGKRKQQSKGGFKTKKEAQLAAAVIEQETAQGTYVKEKNITFEEFSKQWLEIYMNTGKVKISTIRVREHEIAKLMPYFAKMKMNSIKKTDYQNALNDLKKNGKKVIETNENNEKITKNESLSESTLSGVNSTGKMIFKKAVELDIIKSNPTEFAYVPKTNKTVEEIEAEEERVKYLEKEQLALFLETAKEHGLDQDYTIFLLLSYTGMRTGELCALKWKDIDFEDQTISITKTYYNPKNNVTDYRLLTPKTENSKRVIEIDEDVIDQLHRHRHEQNRFKMENRLEYHDADFVIIKKNKYPGYPEIIKTIENRMRRLLKIANLNTDLTPHSLRHTHTSLLAELKVGLQEIMDRLGHKDDDTTRNVYLHVTKTKKKEASQKFAQLMRSL